MSGRWPHRRQQCSPPALRWRATAHGVSRFCRCGRGFAAPFVPRELLFGVRRDASQASGSSLRPLIAIIAIVGDHGRDAVGPDAQTRRAGAACRSERKPALRRVNKERICLADPGKATASALTEARSPLRTDSSVKKERQ